MTITPYNRQSWERVYGAFLDYLGACREHSKQCREHAENRLKARQVAIDEYQAEYRSLNAHLLGIGDYTKTGIRLCPDGQAHPDKPINLTHHANGMPILWRVEPMALADHDALFLAQLRLVA